MTWFRSTPLFRLMVLAGLAGLLSLQTGCYEKATDFTYGKVADQSVNGVSVFANLLRQRGHTVSRKKRLTRRLDKFQTIVWAPDNNGGPPENVAAWMEQWLARDPTRVLIYVGRSYDGKLPFYRSMAGAAPANERDQWQRKFNEILIQEADYDDWFNLETEWKPHWFEKEEDLRLDSSKLGGPWAEGVDPGLVELECSTLITPATDFNDEDAAPAFDVDLARHHADPATDFNDEDAAPELKPEDQDSEYYYDDWYTSFREEYLTTKDLLTVDGKPFAFQVSPATYPGQKLIVVSNGSFLLNFPLTNSEHRKLAAKVADEVKGDVVFIESSYRWPKVGGQANDPALRWTWIGQAPMNYIVPHFLFWGVLYCFVFFPIFGRPKRVQFHPPKAFRSHVEAVASILGRSKEQSWARQVVDLWLARNNKTKG